MNSVSFSYGNGKLILSDVNLSISKGKFYAVIGRNGSGKSTLVNLLSGIIGNYKGEILFNGKNINSLSSVSIARHLSFIPQQIQFFDMNIRVFDFLCLGRYPYKSFTDFRTNNEEKEIVGNALEMLSIVNLKDKLLFELSGGEKQKVIIALAFVQLDCRNDLSEKILIVDEPLTYLDVNYQYDIFNVLAKLNKDKGLTVMTVIHDLNIALKYTDETILLEKGKIVSSGRTLDIITQESLEKYFRIKSQILNFENEFHINFIPN
ncbi:MAG: ABC transporter ATP-binding protein [Ignavibacteria bacterium]